MGIDDEVFCEHCGELSEHATELLRYKERCLTDAENKLRAKRSQITGLKTNRDEQRLLEPLYNQAYEVFEYWKSRLQPTAREFTGPRFDKVVARLKAGHTVDELKRAIDGCVLRPYVTKDGRSATGEADERFADLELICRNENKVLSFTSYADAQGPGQTSADLYPKKRVLAMQSAIDEPGVLARLRELRGWTAGAILNLGLGLDGDRVVFFVYDADSALVGVHRYQPNPERRGEAPKQIATGKRDLFPAPEDYDTTSIWLVEGEPDAVAIASAGLPGVGVPGVATWKEGWAERFAEFDRVYICFDCDEEGRKAAQIRRDQLAKVTNVIVVELDEGREDGYDLGDLLLERGESTASDLSSLATISGGASAPFQPSLNGAMPWQRMIDALDARDLRVVEHNDSRATAQCPNHDDRRPSLSLGLGDDGCVLLHCHAGCTVEEIVGALGMHTRDLFQQRY